MVMIKIKIKIIDQDLNFLLKFDELYMVKYYESISYHIMFI